MKHAGYLTSLKYPQRYTDWKEEPNGQFQHRNCVEYTQSIWKNSPHCDTFWRNSQTWFRYSRLGELGCRILRKIVCHWSCLPQHFNLVLVLHNWMKMDLKNEKLFWRYVEHLPQVTKIPHIQAEMDWGSKNQISSFFSNQWLLLKMKKWKIDEMNADKCPYNVTAITAIGAFFCGP